jgi:hypothetical protein
MTVFRFSMGTGQTCPKRPRYSFRFARVFGPQATQREVFDVVAKVGAQGRARRSWWGLIHMGHMGLRSAWRTWSLEPWMGSTAPFLHMGSGGSQTDAVTGCDGRRRLLMILVVMGHQHMPVAPTQCSPRVGPSNSRTGSGKTYTICWGLRAGSLVRKIKIFQLLPGWQQASLVVRKIGLEDSMNLDS